MSIVIDLNLVCVICLQDGELRSVFEKDEHSELKISDKIMKCSELSIDENSKLPDKICTNCYQDLMVAFQFRQKCEAANAVFSTIQQQEDALANYELEQHKIKIPSGLKIKRIQPEGKTYILPVHVESLPELESIEEESISEVAATCEEIVEHTEPEEIAEEVEEEPEDEEEEEQQMEAIEIDDYYESEEILEEHFEQEIVEIKLETQAAETKDFLPLKSEEPEIQKEVKTNVVIKEEEQDDDEEYVAAENMPPTLQQMLKRGRGRPKKPNASAIKETTSPAGPETYEGKERLKQVSKDRVKNTTATKPSVLKPLTIVQKMRKRNSLSPDAKPTKICDICGNSYKYQHALNAHMRRHNNDRPFNCEFCDKAFVSAVELRRHMRVHTGHKPYACQYCERRFSDFGSRIKHERTHTGERPYNCSTCGKAFAYAHVLSVHLRTHTGEKKFKCNQCGKGFTKKAYLKTHAEQHARAAALAGAVIEATQDMDGGEMTAIKNVGLEECIFTTEYIEDDDDEDTKSVVSATIQLMSEEHLDENDTEMEHDDEDDGVETVTEDYTDIEMRKAKIEVLSDEDGGNYETVA